MCDARIFQEEKESSWNVWQRAINQTVTFPQLFKMNKDLYIIKEHHNWLQSGASIMRCTLYDEYISYPLFTLHASAVARYRSTATGAGQPRQVSEAALCAASLDRHLVYFWWIIIILFSLSSKTSDNRRYLWLSSLHYTIVYRHPELSCDYASFPCHNVFSWKLFIGKCVFNVNSY